MEMKCIHVVEIGSPSTTKISLREPLYKELLIKVEAAGHCRMDLELIRARVGHRDLVLSRIPGKKYRLQHCYSSKEAKMISQLSTLVTWAVA